MIVIVPFQVSTVANESLQIVAFLKTRLLSQKTDIQEAKEPYI